MKTIAKGVEIKPDATIKPYGGSWVVVIPPDCIRSMGITKVRPCRIFRNPKGYLIIDITDNEN